MSSIRGSVYLAALIQLCARKSSNVELMILPFLACTDRFFAGELAVNKEDLPLPERD